MVKNFLLDCAALVFIAFMFFVCFVMGLYCDLRDGRVFGRIRK